MRAAMAGRSMPSSRRSFIEPATRRAGVAGGNHGIRLAVADQFDGADHRGILLLADALERLVVHGQHFAGVDDLDAVVAEAGLLARPPGFQPRWPTRRMAVMDWSASQCPFDAFDDDPATVVATHDIHCNSHNGKSAESTRSAISRRNQAPAVTVMTWRPL